MDNMNNARQDYDMYYGISENVFNEIARSKGLILSQVAIVATYDSTSKKAKVYFVDDLTKQSSDYTNMTGSDLVVGQKVYIFYKYGDTEQGWIMAY